jgi:polyisoprenoid-binding protein YceI
MIQRFKVCVSVGVLSLGLFPAGSTVAAAAPAAGKPCPKLGQKSAQKSGSLVCTKKAGRLVWSRVAATSAATSAGTSPATSVAATSTPPENPKPKQTGIDGTWTVAKGSSAGYRVKEVLQGQDIEAVGRTSAVSGTIAIQGTTVKTVDIKVDLTKLESDSNRRDDQVQGRILETAKYPVAAVKLVEPLDLGAVPADKVEIQKAAKISLNLHGVSKDLALSVQARRNGETIEIIGAVKIVFADFGITNPSLPPLVTTEPDGLLEFLIVCNRA